MSARMTFSHHRAEPEPCEAPGCKATTTRVYKPVVPVDGTGFVLSVACDQQHADAARAEREAKGPRR